MRLPLLFEAPSPFSKIGKFVVLVLLVFGHSIDGTAQDIITMRTGEDVPAKVMEVTPTEIKYKKLDNPDGPTYTANRSDIFRITYANGTKEVFSEEKVQAPAEPTIFPDSYDKGAEDASTYYRKHGGAAAGTFFTSLLVSPVIGLIPAIACSSTPPNELNLNMPHDASVTLGTQYRMGYMQRAHQIKKKKVWGMWGLALGLNIGAAVIYFAVQ